MNYKFNRIVLVTQHYYPDIGGITTWSYQLAKAFNSMGIGTVIITKSYDGALITNEVYEDKRGVKIVRVDNNKWKNKRIFRIKKAVKRFIDKNTVFLCADWKMGAGCYMASFFSNVNYFIAAHGLEILESRKANKVLMKEAFRKSNGAIAVSSYTKNLLQEQLGGTKIEIEIVNNGVDCDVFSGALKNERVAGKYGVNGEFILLSVGRLVKRKGFDKTIEAIARINDPNLRYYIAGKGDYGDYLNNCIKKYNLADRVKLLGYVPDDDLPGLYASSDVFIMPSRELPGDVEGFGIAYLEAAASGIPSIAGKNSGAVDAVIDKSTGLLVDPESVDEIARSILALRDNQDLRKKLGNQAKIRARSEFTWEKIAAKILDFMNGKIADG